jgi:hypothetical protein
MERVSVARMATAKLQGWIHAARGMGASGSVATELNNYDLTHILNLQTVGDGCVGGDQRIRAPYGQ